MQRSILRTFLWIVVVAVIAQNLSSNAAAQSVWQKVKQAALQQECQSGNQKACQDLAKLNQKISQPEQTAQPNAQQQPQQTQRSGHVPNVQQSGQFNDSGPFKPPAGTKIEETVLAPMQERAQFEVSPHGVHVATTENDGSRVVVWYDGVEGPKFDEILPQLNSSRIVFSPDSNRYAYCARSGSEYVVMVDGKELVRSSESNLGHIDTAVCQLGFTSNSKHVFYTSQVATDTQRGKSFKRFWFDGKHGPDGIADTAAFSPDGDHYAYVLTIQDPAHEDRYALIIDGKQASYMAGAPQWSADSKHLYTQMTVALGPGKGQGKDLLLDGRPIARAFNFLLYIPPVGDMAVAIVQGGTTFAPVNFLAIDGKRVPGTDVARPGQIENVVFSPDGKHYAALCRLNQSRQLIVDGKRQPEYQDIRNVKFTADSSKVVYQTMANNKTFVVLGDQESNALQGIPDINGVTLSPMGNRVGAGVQGDSSATWLYLDGKTTRPELRGISQFQFNSDATHFAYISLDSGNGMRLAVDGTPQPASNFGGLSNASTAKFAFSPDGKHIAHLGLPPQPTGDDEHGLFIDGRYVAINHGKNTNFLTFSPDSKHVVWFQMVPSSFDFRILVDGKPVVETEATTGNGINDTVQKWFDFLPDGTLVVLGQDKNSLKRISIMPSPGTSVANLSGGGTLFAAK